MNTIGDALKEIDAALEAVPQTNFTAQSKLNSLKETIRGAVGLAKNPGRNEKIDQAILKQTLPAHIRQLINARLIEIGYTR